MKQKIQLECIVFREVGNTLEFLLLKRTVEKGNFWQPVCGWLEPEDKNLLEGAYREIFEETGIRREDILRVIQNVYYFEMNKDYLTSQPIPTIREYVSGFQVRGDIPVDLSGNIHHEHETYAWVDYHNAMNMLLWEDNKKAFEKLRSLLSQ